MKTRDFSKSWLNSYSNGRIPKILSNYDAYGTFLGEFIQFLFNEYKNLIKIQKNQVSLYIATSTPIHAQK